jgi:hypothetical protein
VCAPRLCVCVNAHVLVCVACVRVFMCLCVHIGNCVFWVFMCVCVCVRARAFLSCLIPPVCDACRLSGCVHVHVRECAHGMA